MKKLINIIFFLISVPNLFSFGGGNGTESDPYQISTKAHLELLADSVNNSAPYPNDNWSKDKYFIVINNITEPVTTVIGRFLLPSFYSFEGNFNGQGYTINLAIDMQLAQYVGLFGNVFNATIQNVIVNGYVSGLFSVAGVVGYAHNTSITNCINKANISGSNGFGGISGGLTNSSSIVNCINIGNISGNAISGGISGSVIASTITNCINIGNVSGITNIGGIGGGVSNESAIANCINIGNVSGSSNISGIVGIASRITIINCINSGYIKGTGEYVGGLLGNYYSYSDYITIENSINSGAVEGANFAGAIAGVMSGGLTITNCHYDKQFCIHKGVNGEDVQGVTAHLTRNMVGRKLASLLGDNDWTYVEGATLIESLYPQLKTLDHTDASKVGATPIFLYDGIKD